MIKGSALAGLSAALLNAGSAQAAVEVANIAASDNRFGTIAFLAVPALAVSLLQRVQHQPAVVGSMAAVGL